MHKQASSLWRGRVSPALLLLLLPLLLPLGVLLTLFRRVYRWLTQ